MGLQECPKGLEASLNRVSKTWYYPRDGAFVLPETIDPDAEVVTLAGPDGASRTVTPQRAVERRDCTRAQWTRRLGRALARRRRVV